jgi:hypothetical protein
MSFAEEELCHFRLRRWFFYDTFWNVRYNSSESMHSMILLKYDMMDPAAIHVSELSSILTFQINCWTNYTVQNVKWQMSMFSHLGILSIHLIHFFGSLILMLLVMLFIKPFKTYVLLSPCAPIHLTGYIWKGIMDKVSYYIILWWWTVNKYNIG